MELNLENIISKLKDFNHDSNIMVIEWIENASCEDLANLQYDCMRQSFVKMYNDSKILSLLEKKTHQTKSK